MTKGAIAAGRLRPRAPCLPRPRVLLVLKVLFQKRFIAAKFVLLVAVSQYPVLPKIVFWYVILYPFVCIPTSLRRVGGVLVVWVTFTSGSSRRTLLMQQTKGPLVSCARPLPACLLSQIQLASCPCQRFKPPSLHLRLRVLCSVAVSGACCVSLEPTSAKRCLDRRGPRGSRRPGLAEWLGFPLPLLVPVLARARFNPFTGLPCRRPSPCCRIMTLRRTTRK